jgi:dynein heavy chain, axonemal
MKESSYADERILWIKSKVESIFSSEIDQNNQEPSIVLSKFGDKKVDIPHVKDLFLDCLERNEEANYRKLLGYLQDPTLASPLLVFWVEKKQGKIEVMADAENVAEDKIESAKVSVVKRTPSMTANSLDPKSSATKRSESLRRPSGTPTSYDSQSLDIAQPALPELSMTPFVTELSIMAEPVLPAKSMNVQIVYEAPVLHMAIEIMPDNLAESNAVYLLRNSPAAIPKFSTSAGNLET